MSALELGEEEDETGRKVREKLNTGGYMTKLLHSQYGCIGMYLVA